MPAAAHAAAVRLRPRAARRCAAPTGREQLPRHHRRASAPRCPTPRSPPTSSSASPARPRRTSRRPSTSCATARFAAAFTFQYSNRPGTPAATLPDQVPEGRRPGALRAARRAAGARSRWAENRALVGRDGRAARRRRARAARTPRPAGCPAAPATAGWCTSRRPATAPRASRPGDVVTVGGHLRRAAPPRRRRAVRSVRRTRAGDAWERRTAPAPVGVSLGLPTVGAPPLA